MSRQGSLNSSISSNWKTTSYRKRKRSKWKKFVSSGGDADAFENENFSGWRTGPIWYWSNYHKALEWQSKHELALWKSYSLGLQQENRTLMMELRKLFPGRAFNMPLTLQNLEQAIQIPCQTINIMNSVKSDVEEEGSNLGNEGIEFEMSEEMMKFFEESIKHKLEMKRLKEEECDRISVEVKESQESHDEREKEMKLLYGDGSSMIIGMETAVQLSFDKYCDLKSPKYWPNIPLKL